MKPARASSLEELAARIDEGRPVDWADEAAHAPDAESRGIIRGLQVLAEVRGILLETDGGATSRPEAQEPAGPCGAPWGQLSVFEALGRGAFGTVHRAVDTLGRNVALKLLDPALDLTDLRRRIFDEARLLARVQHPNIVVVHGAGESDGRVGLWMEFVKGRTLAAEVDARGRLSGDEAAVIGRTLCSTLAAIHREGVVHADVKPQNVMRENGGRIVLMDFGAGQVLVDADPRRLAGTPLYLSPERLAGGPLTPACDIYSLGVLLYYLVTGTHPVEGETREDVERAHREQRRVLLRDRRSDLPAAFVAAVEDALAPNPRLRHQTAGAFEAALARGASPRLPADENSSSDAHVGPPKKNRWFPTLAAAAAVLVVSTLGIKAVVDNWPGRSDGTAKATPLSIVPAPPGYSVRAVFYGVDEKARRALAPGARVTTGDALELDITLSDDAYVYVVNEDEVRTVSPLFPLPGGRLQNPLRGGQTHVLPGPRGDQPQQWAISSAGGREHFFVVVSPTPVPEVEAAIAGLTPPSSETTTTGVERSALRGVTGLKHLQPPRTEPNAPWRRGVLPLPNGVERVTGQWVRQLTLENPAH